MKFEMEQVYEIWDERGDCLEIGPDRDALGLIEIRQRYSGEITNRISLEKEQAKLLISALARTIGE